MRRELAVAVLGGVAFALTGCGGSGGISLPCAPQPKGALCVKVFHDGRTVKDAIGYLAASESPLAGQTWRLVLMAGGRLYPGPTRHGNPPRVTECRPSSTVSGCHDTLASEYAAFGDFAGFSVPKKLASRTELCVVEQIRTGGTWETQTTPARACSTLS